KRASYFLLIRGVYTAAKSSFALFNLYFRMLPYKCTVLSVVGIRLLLTVYIQATIIQTNFIVVPVFKQAVFIKLVDQFVGIDVLFAVCYCHDRGILMDQSGDLVSDPA